MNALVNPMDIQQGVMGAFQAGRSMRAQNETQNALASLVGNPGDQQAMTRLAQFNPQAAFAMQDRLAQQQDFALRRQAEQQKQRQVDLGTVRKLLRQAKTNPMQALQAAQEMGIDVSRVPQPDSPEFQGWVDQQIFIADAMEGQEETLSGMAKELVDAGYKPNTPEFEDAMRKGFEGKYSTEYTDATGNKRRRSVFGRPVQPTPEAIQALRNGAGTPEQFDAIFGPGAANRALQGGQPAQGTSPFAMAFQDTPLRRD